MRGGLDLSSSSTSTKVNRLVIKCLHFWSVRGDLQEGHGCASRCQLPIFPMPIPIISSTKSGFLCAFALRNPRFRAFRAQNRGFCALFAYGTPVFGHSEHKIGIFVRCLANKTSLLPETWLSVSENCGGKHNSGLVRCFQTHSKSRFVIFQKFITPVKILLQRVWSSPSLLLQLAACCLLLAACRQSVLCRVGKEGKIAFAGVIGEGLF